MDKITDPIKNNCTVPLQGCCITDSVYALRWYQPVYTDYRADMYVQYTVNLTLQTNHTRRPLCHLSSSLCSSDSWSVIVTTTEQLAGCTSHKQTTASKQTQTHWQTQREEERSRDLVDGVQVFQCCCEVSSIDCLTSPAATHAPQTTRTSHIIYISILTINNNKSLL